MKLHLCTLLRCGQPLRAALVLPVNAWRLCRWRQSVSKARQTQPSQRPWDAYAEVTGASPQEQRERLARLQRRHTILAADAYRLGLIAESPYGQDGDSKWYRFIYQQERGWVASL